MRPTAWLACAGVLAMALGAGIVASGTWVAWRVRFHPPVTGAIARALASAYGAEAGGWVGYRAGEAWASRGLLVAGAGLAALLVAVSARAIRARWFRWLGWLPVIALLLIATSGALGAAGLGAALVLERCHRHPSLPSCQGSDEPRGADPAVTKSEPEWLVATGGTAVLAGAMGSMISAIVIGGAWIVSVGVGAAELLRARRGRATPPAVGRGPAVAARADRQ